VWRTESDGSRQESKAQKRVTEHCHKDRVVAAEKRRCKLAGSRGVGWLDGYIRLGMHAAKNL